MRPHVLKCKCFSVLFIFTIVNIQKLKSGFLAFFVTQEIQVIYRKKQEIYTYICKSFSYRSPFHYTSYMYSFLFNPHYSRRLTIIQEVNWILYFRSLIQNIIFPEASFHFREIKATEWRILPNLFTEEKHSRKTDVRY